jgi:hypothetical protein
VTVLQPMEVCALRGIPQTAAGLRRLSRLVAAKLRNAKGRLDQYDPRLPGRPAQYTMVSLGRLFPEMFEPRDELAAELREQFDEIRAAVDEQAARIGRLERASLMRDEALAKAVRELRIEVRALRGKNSAA